MKDMQRLKDELNRLVTVYAGASNIPAIEQLKLQVQLAKDMDTIMHASATYIDYIRSGQYVANFADGNSSSKL